MKSAIYVGVALALMLYPWNWLAYIWAAVVFWSLKCMWDNRDCVLPGPDGEPPAGVNRLIHSSSQPPGGWRWAR